MESRSKRSVHVRVDDELSDVLRNIDNGYRIIILLRGLPGSGKSTLASYIVERSALENKRSHILSTDDYFYQRGKYNYDVNRLGDAHAWNQSRAKNLMSKGFSPLIIDNTNCVVWEMLAYVKDAVANGYIIKILEPKNDWTFRPKELAHKNSHGVPFQKIKRMLERYEKGVTAESLIRAWNLSYVATMIPPVLRSSPLINCVSKCTTAISETNNIEMNTLIHDKPKPPRDRGNVNKQNKKGLLLSNSEISVDWEPINETFNSWSNEFPINTMVSQNFPVSKCDASTNTCSEDINVNNQQYFKIIWAFSREINNTSLQNTNQSPKSLLITFDKSTMTDDIYDLWKNMEAKPNLKKYEQELDELKILFPDVYVENLRDVLEHCEGDINLAGNTLLDSEKLIQITKLPENISTDETIETPEEVNVHVDEEITELHNIKQSPETPNYESNFKATEDQTILKKEIEKNFVFSDNHYSNHILKIKRRNRGEKPNNTETILENSKDEIGECSKNIVDGNFEETVENDTVVSVNVGNQFIEELEKIFDSSYSISNHLNPVIHMPMSLVHQIHALWLESLCDQIYVQQELSRKFIREDEEFAKTLEMLENSQEDIATVQETPNLQVIMDMELALALYKTDVMELKNETPDNMASRLTHQKLVQLFPGVNSNTLKEIHCAHDNKFEQTVEALMSSTGLLKGTDSENDNKRAIQEFLMKNEKDLLDRAKKEKERVFNEKANILEISPVKKHNASFDLYRQEADRHLQIRNLNYAKAQEYHRQRKYQVATYYLYVASLHTKRYDDATTMVASEMVQMASSKGDFTLDLHHLNVIEAVKVLDLFIDKHILRMQQEILTKMNPGMNTVVKLFLVTGRGRHSPGGQPKIKPAICKRLKERQIKYNEINPGLIGIYLTPKSNLNTNKNN